MCSVAAGEYSYSGPMEAQVVPREPASNASGMISAANTVVWPPGPAVISTFSASLGRQTVLVYQQQLRHLPDSLKVQAGR